MAFKNLINTQCNEYLKIHNVTLEEDIVRMSDSITKRHKEETIRLQKKADQAKESLTTLKAQQQQGNVDFQKARADVAKAQAVVSKEIEKSNKLTAALQRKRQESKEREQALNAKQVWKRSLMEMIHV